jgi:ABC-2 type transport system ATP-binding protein
MIEIAHVTHRYGQRTALDDFSLEIARGEVFAMLGPNGSGKTTLFRLLSTLLPPQQGHIQIAGCDLKHQMLRVRKLLGVVFQAPSVDRKLTVRENLTHQGRLYGLTGERLKSKQAELLERLGLTDRAGELVEKLSGGLRRRVELAKGLLHDPQVVLLDEPTTGLDPGARADLWEYLFRLRDERGVTIVMTTHLLEEADRADRIAILHAGQLVALGPPDVLRAEVGGDSITLRSLELDAIEQEIRIRWNLDVLRLPDALRLELPHGHEWIARLVEAFGSRISSITLAGPTLEDVFIDRTGHRFWNAEDLVPTK